MSKNVDFQVGTIVSDTFLDNLQEVLTGSISNFRLEPLASTNQVRLQVPGNILYDGYGSINIAGQYCTAYNGVTSSSVVGGAGDKLIYVATTESGSSFSVQIRDSGSPPTEDYVRAIGSATWDGTQLTDIKFSPGVNPDADQYNSFTYRTAVDLAGETLLTLRGQDAQVSPVNISNPAGVSATPTKLLSAGHDVSSSYEERFYIDSDGRLVWVDQNGGPSHGVISWYDDNNTPVAVAPSLVTNVPFASWSNGSGALSFTARRGDSDTADVWTLDNAGVMSWGSGSAATDTNLYRSAANTLKTDDTLIVGVSGGAKTELQIISTTANTGITIGGDTNLYRSAANTLKTDDKLVIGAGHNIKTTPVSSNYSVDISSDHVILVDTTSGAVTITLPATHTAGDVIIVKDDVGMASTYNITLTSADSDDLDGDTQIVMDYAYQSVHLVSNGTDWRVI